MNRLLTLVLCSSLLIVSSSAVAHGEADESVAEFHLHMDDYRDEIEGFIGKVNAIVETHAAGDNAQGGVDELIQRWEEIAVHDAVEAHAMVMYPSIWQGILGLQHAVLEGQPPAAVSEAGQNLEAALWQAFGALRLAAAQRADGGDRGEAHHDHHHNHHHDHDDHHHGDGHEHHGDDHQHHDDQEHGAD